MFIIGITGGTGAGKTSALRALEKLGALIIDCDAVYHRLLQESAQMKDELALRFEGVLTDGAIDRKKLGGIVFADPSALMDLNTITHKYVTRETDRLITEWARQGGRVSAVDAIALIESGIASKCDVVVGVTAPVEMRVKRIAARDALTPEQALKRINAQKPDSFFEQNCDFILENAYNKAEEFENRCGSFFADIIKNTVF